MKTQSVKRGIPGRPDMPSRPGSRNAPLTSRDHGDDDRHDELNHRHRHRINDCQNSHDCLSRLSNNRSRPPRTTRAGGEWVTVARASRGEVHRTQFRHRHSRETGRMLQRSGRKMGFRPKSWTVGCGVQSRCERLKIAVSHNRQTNRFTRRSFYDRNCDGRQHHDPYSGPVSQNRSFK